MTQGLPDEDGGLTVAGVESVLEASERGGALALGPGLGRRQRGDRRLRASLPVRRRSRWCSTPTG